MGSSGPTRTQKRVFSVVLWAVLMALPFILAPGFHFMSAANKPGTPYSYPTPNRQPLPSLAGAAASPSPGPRPGDVVVVHWANNHMMRPTLLPQFAADFNAAQQTVRSGKRIFVQVRGHQFRANCGRVDWHACRTARPSTPSSPTRWLLPPPPTTGLASRISALGKRSSTLAAPRPLPAPGWASPPTARWRSAWAGRTRTIRHRRRDRSEHRPTRLGCCPTAKMEWGQQPLISFTDPLLQQRRQHALRALLPSRRARRRKR